MKKLCFIDHELHSYNQVEGLLATHESIMFICETKLQLQDTQNKISSWISKEKMATSYSFTLKEDYQKTSHGY